MTRPESNHHINFLFVDLDAAVRRISALLGDCKFIREDLAERGVRTARTGIRESWLVLVSPIDPQADTEPARHLRKHGEGFFLRSFGVADLDRALHSLDLSSNTREGLDRWRIADLPKAQTLGLALQFTLLPHDRAD